MSDRWGAILEGVYGLIYLTLSLLVIHSMGATLIRWLKRERTADGAARISRREIEEQRASARSR